MKKALITGITAQVESQFLDFSQNNGHELQGIRRRLSLINICRINHLHQVSNEIAKKLKN